jgi:hypothetical protein
MQRRNGTPISRCLLLSLAALLAGANVMGQDKDFWDNKYTAGFFNGRAWEEMNTTEKVSFFMGFEQGVRVSSIAQQGADKSEDAVNAYSAKGFTNGDYVKELDKLYADRENILISVRDAIRYCTRKLGGTYTNAQLEQYLIGLRKAASASEEKKP